MHIYKYISIYIFVKKLFVNLITVAVFYCRYVIDKDVVESFYK